ncbi:hypothetical protein ASE01_08105 [Nocardioides sp. Root190]|uniref:hypothetical protein n=1 Tax=Nocardioides sp. Root190 TaxID=1736488 RepID=UPI0007016592|nr:hypothetical protein [Nocardioides sp. Root190]KRB78111.1 hypothetical protein ASE01_08105 [Nocardioides sp. Root190]
MNPVTFGATRIAIGNESPAAHQTGLVMDHSNQHSATRRKHLLTAEELASHAGITPDALARGHRHGNGIRVHRTYIFVVSMVTLVLLVGAIAMASAQM